MIKKKNNVRTLQPDLPYGFFSKEYIFKVIYEILNLTEDSIGYSRRDVHVLMEYISNQVELDQQKEKIETHMKSIESLPFSVRTKNCLRCENIYLIGDLIYQTEMDLLKTPNLGKKSLIEIKEVLEGNNLTLGMEIDWPPSSESRGTPREIREKWQMEIKKHD